MSHRVRILYSHRIASRDGQAVHLESLIAALRRQGHEVEVVGPSAYAEARFGDDGGWVARLRRALPRAVAELAELAYAIPAALRLDRAARTGAFDALYERYNLFHFAGSLVARRRRLPFLLEVNAPLAEERARFGGLAWPGLARWAERFVWRRADLALPVTEVLAGHLRAAGVPAERIVVVPNGIDLAAFPPDLAARQAGEEAREIVLGFVGFVREWHGLEAVVRGIAAWQGRQRLALVVVGDGPARPGLARLAAELGIAERVRFTGLAEREEIPRLVASFDVALQPAAVPYACPLKLVEYMAAGRAIVAPDQPNIRELVAHERTALLFPPGDVAAMWAAIARLAGEASLRARLGAAARAEVLARDLTWDGNARRVAALVRGLRSGAAPVSVPAGAGTA
ncbi:glycosyltransferase family 4 protein [Elioraea thermophila]|uniref:glycosyltransferase family 4 protein n=1 Tax=Elioraea thermophila TaxID=2185104 RepID=UPI001E4E81CA|nr:glycosyltransferase family 4 protein [Elioraea thermophila]